MLLDVDLNTRTASRRTGSRLSDFGLNERGFQEVLFNSLDRLLPDDQLLLIMQSANWREEPDLLALDAEGRLFIFELKAFESRQENVLQALRYGQKFGQYDYGQLAALYRRERAGDNELHAAHAAKFDVELPLDAFNHGQVFVVMTNGLDVGTREAIQYWRAQKLRVEPWVYRVYDGAADREMLVEMHPFRVGDDPYEDVVSGYSVLNTNYGNNPDDDADMLANQKAAAFYEPWKYKITRLSKGDTVFLYRVRHGIVAFGHADGRLQQLSHHDHPDEQYAMNLTTWSEVDPPLSAAEIKEITGIQHSFRGTMFSLEPEAGRRLEQGLRQRVAAS